jgi:peroxiredoxin
MAASIERERPGAAEDEEGATKMAIGVGDRIPDVEVRTMTPEGQKTIRTGEALGTGKVVLFAVPGAFTPTCSDYHLPGFVLRADELAAKGVSTVACVAVNDAFVMGAWGVSQQVGDAVLLLADGNAEFTRAMGRELDGGPFGMGPRSQRYAVVVEDGIVTELAVEEGAGLDVSSADAVLALL